MRIVKIEQNMDSAAMAEMKPVFEDLAASLDDVCFDLNEVEFLDSSGVGAIVYVFKRLRQRAKRVVLTNVTGQPLTLLQQLKLDSFIEATPAGA